MTLESWKLFEALGVGSSSAPTPKERVNREKSTARYSPASIAVFYVLKHHVLHVALLVNSLGIMAEVL